MLILSSIATVKSLFTLMKESKLQMTWEILLLSSTHQCMMQHQEACRHLAQLTTSWHHLMITLLSHLAWKTTCQALQITSHLVQLMEQVLNMVAWLLHQSIVEWFLESLTCSNHQYMQLVTTLHLAKMLNRPSTLQVLVILTLLSITESEVLDMVVLQVVDLPVQTCQAAWLQLMQVWSKNT